MHERVCQSVNGRVGQRVYSKDVLVRVGGWEGVYV